MPGSSAPQMADTELTLDFKFPTLLGSGAHDPQEIGEIKRQASRILGKDADDELDEELVMEISTTPKSHRRDSMSFDMSQRSPSSILQTTLVDPFSYDGRVTVYECLKRSLVLVFLFPLRLVIFVLSAVLVWILAFLGTRGVPLEEEHSVWQHHKAFPRWRALLLSPLVVLIRIVLWCAGFWYIRVIDHRREKSVKPQLMVVAPHVSMLDMLVMMYVFPGSGFVGLRAVTQIPLVRDLGTASQGVFIDASDEKSRDVAKAAIEARAGPHWSGHSISIFPEGTITNGQALIQFRMGAFVPGKPVLPVVLHYPWRNWNIAWVGRNRTPTWFMRLMLQVTNHCVVEILDVYYPSAEEQADPQAYAGAVRNLMAKKLDLPTTNHSYTDARLYHDGGACKAKVIADFEVRDAKNLFGLEQHKLEACVRSFNKADCNKDGRISFADFVAAFNFRNAPLDAVRYLFEFMDADGNEHVDFREYIQMIGILQNSSRDQESRMTLAWLVSKVYNFQELGSEEKLQDSESSRPDSEDFDWSDMAFRDFVRLAQRSPTVVDNLLGHLQDQLSINDMFSS